MTGPEHYREAERLEAQAQELLVKGVYNAEESLKRVTAVLVDTQVHSGQNAAGVAMNTYAHEL
jgi:hypothetical protein